jgi:hypothetical protein
MLGTRICNRPCRFLGTAHFAGLRKINWHRNLRLNDHKMRGEDRFSILRERVSGTAVGGMGAVGIGEVAVERLVRVGGNSWAGGVV